ncbi:MAG: hypothetical protein J6T27_04130 [Alphaproteobacteria bacterium]|nr:hypothetical protein [Alphaproteobacteria bacterium]
MVSIPGRGGAHASKWGMLRASLDVEKQKSPKTTDKEIEILKKLYETFFSTTEFLYSMAPDEKSRKSEFRRMVWDSIFNRRASYEQICKAMEFIHPSDNTIWKEMFYALNYTEADVKWGKDLIRAAGRVLRIGDDEFDVLDDLVVFYRELMDDSKDDYYPKILVGSSDMLTIMLQELNSKMMSKYKSYRTGMKKMIYDDGTLARVMSFLRDTFSKQARNVHRSAQLKNAYRQIIDNIHKIEMRVLQNIQDEDKEFFKVVYTLTEPVQFRTEEWMY